MFCSQILFLSVIFGKIYFKNCFETNNFRLLLLKKKKWKYYEERVYFHEY